MKHSRLTVAAMGAVLACATLLGCQAAVTTPTPEPEPEPPEVALTLQGTWRATETWVDDDGMMISGVQILTFTGGGRAILYNAEYDASGTLVDDWTQSSGWSATADTVTRRWLGDHDDDGETSDIMREVAKRYYWGAGRATMFMAPWNRDDPDSDLAHHERVTDPLPDGLTGVWTYDTEWDRREDLGYIVGQHWMFTFGEDGAFTEVYRNTRRDTDESGYFTVIGTWRHVDEDPNSILVDVESATYLRPDGTLNDLAESAPYWIGATMRYAYAPTDSPDLITVSTRVAELMYDADAGMWVDNMYNPYGDYWMRLSRQQ